VKSGKQRRAQRLLGIMPVKDALLSPYKSYAAPDYVMRGFIKTYAFAAKVAI
jgi:hypothetical protein